LRKACLGSARGTRCCTIVHHGHAWQGACVCDRDFFSNGPWPLVGHGVWGAGWFWPRVWPPGTARAIRLATAGGLANSFAMATGQWPHGGQVAQERLQPPPPSRLTLRLSCQQLPIGWWCWETPVCAKALMRLRSHWLGPVHCAVALSCCCCTEPASAGSGYRTLHFGQCGRQQQQ
jgi:hypothetical protein